MMAKQKINWFKYASPANFYPLAGKMIPWFGIPAAILFIAGLYVGFFIAPTDFQQGEAYRIIFIHVPAAWMGMFLSGMMAISSAVAIFTFIALVTGSLWGRPAWGVWWVWDARLTSTLILMFLYIGFISLQSSIDDPRRADRAGAVLALVGVINVPIIYFSVQWWNSLHQGATITARSFKMAPSMLAAMLILLAAGWMYSITVFLMRVRSIVQERERESPWLVEAVAL